MNSKTIVACVFGMMLCSNIVFADVASEYANLREALHNGKIGLSFRLRHENAKEENLKTAKATTLRSKISYESASYAQFKLALEMIDVSKFFGQRYNPQISGIARPEFTKINDPKGTGISAVNITSQHFQYTDIVFGRQKINLDNQRMIGNSDFRQFPTSFDSLSIKNTMLEDFEIFYAYADHFNSFHHATSSSEGRRKLNTHLANVGWQGFRFGKLSAYAYFNKDRSLNTNSQTTIGVRGVANERFKETYNFDYSAELASQHSRSSNPNSYSAYYLLAELGKDISIVNGKIGFERLGGHRTDSGKSFIFPLGSTHEFQGIADGFTTTPSRGLHDYYIKLAAKASDVLTFKGAFHLFRFAAGTSSSAGHEFDLRAIAALSEEAELEIAYAKLNAKRGAALDTRRVWISLLFNAI